VNLIDISPTVFVDINPALSDGAGYSDLFRLEDIYGAWPVVNKRVSTYGMQIEDIRESLTLAAQTNFWPVVQTSAWGMWIAGQLTATSFCVVHVVSAIDCGDLHKRSLLIYMFALLAVLAVVYASCSKGDFPVSVDGEHSLGSKMNDCAAFFDQWMMAAKAFSARCIILVTKHCGFVNIRDNATIISAEAYAYANHLLDELNQQGAQQSSWRNWNLILDFVTCARKHGVLPGDHWWPSSLLLAVRTHFWPVVQTSAWVLFIAGQLTAAAAAVSIVARSPGDRVVEPPRSKTP
jgi:hypothetical protein